MIAKHKNILIIVSLIALAGLAFALSGNGSKDPVLLGACGAKVGAGCAPAAPAENGNCQDSAACSCEACECATAGECKDCDCQKCACRENCPKESDGCNKKQSCKKNACKA